MTREEGGRWVSVKGGWGGGGGRGGGEGGRERKEVRKARGDGSGK